MHTLLCSFALVTLLSLGSAQAQSLLVPRSGAFVSIDLAGGPFPMLTPAGADLSGGVGVRLGRGVDVAVILGYGGAVADTLFPYPADIHAGIEASATWAERSPWRASVAANVSVSGSSTFLFPPGGGQTTTEGGPDVIEQRGRATLARYLRLADGSVRVLGGAGVYGSVRRVESSRLVLDVGTPDERVLEDDATLETSVGAVVALPVAVQLGPRADVVIEPELRLGLETIAFGIVGDGQITIRLNL